MNLLQISDLIVVTLARDYVIFLGFDFAFLSLLCFMLLRPFTRPPKDSERVSGAELVKYERELVSL